MKSTRTTATAKPVQDIGKQGTVEVSALVLDYNIYPRHHIDAQHAAHLAEAIRSGATLPPVVVDKKSMRVVDGFHRTRAHSIVYGTDARVPVEFRNYANEAELFRESVRLNAGHGERLTAFDVARCTQLAEQLGIEPEALAADLNMTSDKLAKLTLRKTALAEDGHVEPIRRSVAHLAGQQMTKKQRTGAQQMGGLPLLYSVNQVITAIEHDLVPQDTKLLDRMAKLEKLLSRFTKKLAA